MPFLSDPELCRRIRNPAMASWCVGAERGSFWHVFLYIYRCKIAHGLGSPSLIWINSIPARISKYIDYKAWDKMAYLFQTSNVQPLKFRNGYVISYDTWLGVCHSIVVPAMIIRPHGTQNKSPRLYVNRWFRLCDQNLQRECLKVMKSQSYKLDQQNLFCNILYYLLAGVTAMALPVHTTQIIDSQYASNTRVPTLQTGMNSLSFWWCGCSNV